MYKKGEEEFMTYPIHEQPRKGPSWIGLTNYLAVTFSIV